MAKLVKMRFLHLQQENGESHTHGILPRDLDGSRIVRRLAGLGLSAELVSKRPPFPAMDREAGAVAGVGTACTVAARLYSSALGRQLLTFDHIGELVTAIASGPHSSIFAFLPEEVLDLSRALDLLTLAGARHLRLGLFPLAADPEEAAFAAARLLALGLRRRVPRHPILLYCDLVPEIGEIGPGILGFGARTSDDFAAALSAGAEAVVLHTHSNGADLRLGGNVLCVQADHLKPADGRAGETFLPCQSGGPCLRAKIEPLSFIGAASLRTRVVVLMTCTAFLTSGGILDPRFGFGNALLRGGEVEGLVASIRVHGIRAENALACSDFLSKGGCLGDLALHLNRTLRDSGAYLCIGDPELMLRLQPRLDAPIPFQRSSSPASPLQPTGSGLAPAHRLAATVVQGALEDGLDDEAAALARQILPRLRHAAAGPTPAGPIEGSQLDRDLCRLLGKVLSDGAFVHKYWSGALCFTTESRTGNVHGPCNLPLFRFDTMEKVPKTVATRWLWTCARCGVVGDTPTGVPLPALRLSGQAVEVDLTTMTKTQGTWLTGTVEAVGWNSEIPLPERWVKAGQKKTRLPLVSSVPMSGCRWFALAAVWGGNYLVARIQLPQGATSRRR